MTEKQVEEIMNYLTNNRVKMKKIDHKPQLYEISEAKLNFKTMFYVVDPDCVEIIASFRYIVKQIRFTTFLNDNFKDFINYKKEDIIYTSLKFMKDEKSPISLKSIKLILFTISNNENIFKLPDFIKYARMCSIYNKLDEL